MDKEPSRSVNQIVIHTKGKGSKKTEHCQAFKRGCCYKGEYCEYTHVDGIPCENYKNGYCHWGARCKYEHGEGDQSNVADNRDDGYPGKKRLCLDGGPAGGKNELLDQSGVPHGVNSNFSSQFASGPPYGPYPGTANVSACDQVNPNYGMQSSTVNPNYGTQSSIVGSGGQNFTFLPGSPAPRFFGKKDNWKTRICPRWQKGNCPQGSFCTFAHGEHELRGHNGAQYPLISYPRTESAAAPRGPCHIPANVPASNQVISNIGTQSAASDPRWAYHGTTNVSASDRVISTTGTQSATADPRGAYHGTTTANPPYHPDPKHPYNWNRKTNTIFADWIDDVTQFHKKKEYDRSN